MKIISITISLLFVYWRNYCSIIQIKTYYEKSDLKKISNIAYNMDPACFKNEKMNRSKIYDVLNIIPPKNKIFIETILALKYCLSETSFIDTISISLTKKTMNFDLDIIRQNYKREQNNQLVLYDNTLGNQIADEFDLIPFHLKEMFLKEILFKISEKNTFNIPSIIDIYEIVSPVKNKTTLQYFYYLLNEISNESDVLKSIKNGHYIINLVESINVELMTRLNKLIYTIKDSQNKVEYSIKQITMESSYLFGLISNYLYFLLCSVSLVIFWFFYLIKNIRYTKNQIKGSNCSTCCY